MSSLLRWGLVSVVLIVIAQGGVPVAAGQAAPGGSPIATPGGTPVALGDGFELLYRYAAEDLAGALLNGPVMLGELRNATDRPAVAPVVRFTLLDHAGAALGFVDAMPLAHYVPAGERVPIFADATNFNQNAPGVVLGRWRGESIARCDTGLTLAEVDPTGLEIRGERYQEYPELGPGSFTIDGAVVNNTAAEVPHLDVAAAFYAADGRFVGFDSEWVALPTAAGASAPFVLDAHQFSALPGLRPEERGQPFTYRLMVRRDQRFQPAVCGAPIA